MYKRYIYSIIVGTSVTVGLLFIMQLLIASGKSALTEPRARHLLEISPVISARQIVHCSGQPRDGIGRGKCRP